MLAYELIQLALKLHGDARGTRVLSMDRHDALLPGRDRRDQRRPPPASALT